MPVKGCHLTGLKILSAVIFAKTTKLHCAQDYQQKKQEINKKHAHTNCTSVVRMFSHILISSGVRVQFICEGTILSC